jgi:hypothetical protein
MSLKVHQSADRIRVRRERLLALQLRIQQQINDADCLLETLQDYCTENPDDCACAGNDPSWQEQLIRQREELTSLRTAVREKLRKCLPTK